MARSARAYRFTIYDVMESKGIFEANPANNFSPQYAGPQVYPRMLYHPKGAVRTTQRAEIVKLADGSVESLGLQTELVTRVVQNAEEEEEATREGWHTHPAKAIVAGGGNAPMPDSKTEELEAEIRRLQAEVRESRQPAPIKRELGI